MNLEKEMANPDKPENELKFEMTKIVVSLRSVCL
jgi:hypothetical protein